MRIKREEKSRKERKMGQVHLRLLPISTMYAKSEGCGVQVTYAAYNVHT